MAKPSPSVPSAGDSDEDVHGILSLAHAHLGMEASFLFQIVDGEQVIRAVAGEWEIFGLQLDGRAGIQWDALEGGEVQPLLVEGRAADVRARGRAREAGCVGVPLFLPGGGTYGALCCVGGGAPRRLDEHDRGFLALAADMLGNRLQHDEMRVQRYKRLAGVAAAGSFAIALQPVVDALSGALVGVEALARFFDGIGPPDMVFAQAHELGLGVELEIAAFEASRTLADRLPPNAYLAMNMSPAALMDARTLEALAQVEDPTKYVLELTEHVSVDGYDRMIAALAPHRERGFRLAVDDVGAGYASFHHVLELVPDIIKIDRSLVAGVASDGARRRLITSLVLLGLDLAASVVAEGVEEQDDLAILIDLGVDTVQGFLLGRPTLEPDEVDAWREGWDLKAATLLKPQLERKAAFGALLRELRGGQRQVDVLRAINEHLAAAGETMRVSQGQYSAYEHGRERPHPIRVRAIEAVLGVGPGELERMFPPADKRPRGRPATGQSGRPSAATRLGEVRRRGQQPPQA